MRFDNGAADRQTQPHTGVLGGEEAVEQVVEMLRLDAGAAVFKRAGERARIV